MVAIISGNGLGLDSTSLATLGQQAATGAAGQGRNGERAYVNIATGNLVLQDFDDRLMAHGQNVNAVRTYNSLGKLNDDNSDNWTVGLYKRAKLNGSVNKSGSTVTRTDGDAGESLYAYDAARGLYVSTDGAGAYDTIAYDSATGTFVWTDGATGVTERYQGNGLGPILSITDPSGNQISYSYAANGMLTQAVDASGEITYLDYANNDLTQIRTVIQTADGPQTVTRTRYVYDNSHRLASVTVDLSPDDNSIADGRTYKTIYTYEDTSRRVASITQSDGTSQSFTYIKVGADYRVASATDGLGNVTRFTYDVANRRSTVTDPLGLVTVYEYDAKGQLARLTGPAVGGVSQVRNYTYDANGNVTRIVDPEGHAVDMQYDANGNQTLQRDSAGNTVARTYGTRFNQLLTETVYVAPDPDGPGAAQPGQPLTTRYVYDDKNRLRFTISQEGRVTEYRYNGFGERTASLQFTETFYPTGSLAADTSPSEATMQAWVAGIGRSQSVRSDMTYDFRGQLKTTTTYSRVDAAGNGIADGTHAVTQYVYDQAGQLLSTIAPKNNQTQYSYDGLGRLLSTVDALGQATLTQYDDAGNKTIVRLVNGLSTISAFDKAGRLVSVSRTDAAAQALGETRYFYDADGRLRMTQDPTGVRQFMLYDEAGRRVADIDGDGSLVEYRYNRDDQMVRKIAYATAVDLSLLVDAQGKPTNVALSAVRPLATSQDRSTWNAYDLANRLVESVDEAGFVTENIYDGASRVVSSVRYASAVDVTALGEAPLPADIAPAASAADRIVRSLYDGDGLLRATLDAEGNLVEYRYNARGQLIEQIAYANPAPAIARATGDLASLIPAASPADIHSYVLYNARGQETSRIDGEGYLTERVYDRNGNLTQTVRYATRVSYSAGITLAALRPPSSAQDQASSFAYDALNRLILETDAEGTQTAYRYDAVGNLISQTHAANTTDSRTLTSRYDAQGRLIAELSAEGSALLTGDQTQPEIDAIWQAYGNHYTYDAAGRRTSATDANGNRTLFYYDADSRLTHTINALGEVEEHRYNALNQLTGTLRYGTRIDPTGLAGGLADASLTGLLAAARHASLDSQTTFAYNRTGTVKSSTDELGNVTRYTYDAFGEVTSRTRPIDATHGLTETFRYDRRGLQIGSTADPNGLNLSTATTYDAFGRVVRRIDGNGKVHRTSYDRLGRIIATIDPLNAVRRTSYDAIGRVLSQTDATGNTTRYRYDSAARSVTMTTAEGIVVTTVHNRHGQTQSITDGRGNSTEYAYDRNGNLVQTSTPQTQTSAAFDHANRLIETVDANGNQVQYHYDAANRLLSRRLDPAGLNLTSSYQYDAKGQQITSIDANGIVTQTQFDLKGQVVSQTVDPAGLNLVTRYSHDASGNVLTVTSPGGTVVQYGYDSLGRRIEEHVDPAGLDLTRRYRYDGNGNMVGAQDGNGNLTRYVYDAADRLVYTINAEGGVVEYRYDAEGRGTRTATYATPISLADLDSAPSAAQVQARLTACPGCDSVQQQRYDGDGRLIRTIDGTGGVTDYRYDGNGNVVERVEYAHRIDPEHDDQVPVADPAHDLHVRTVYDALNQAIYSIDGTGAVAEQHYDGNGNLIERIAYAATVPVSTAATASALAAAVAGIADSAHDLHVRHSYDAANRLSYSVDGVGAVTQSIYDGNGNLVRQISYAVPIAPHAAPESVAASAGDRIVQMSYDAANRLVYRTDPMGSVSRQIYDANGNAVQRIDYANSVTPGANGATVVADAAQDRITRLVYDSANRQVFSIDAQGDVNGTRYDGAGNVTATISYASAIDLAGLAEGATVAEVQARLQQQCRRPQQPAQRPGESGVLRQERQPHQR